MLLARTAHLAEFRIDLGSDASVGALEWKLSRIKRAFLAQGTDEVGAAVAPLAKMVAANINVIAADAISAGEGRFGMIFWVDARNYNRAAKLLDDA